MTELQEKDIFLACTNALWKWFFFSYQPDINLLANIYRKQTFIYSIIAIKTIRLILLQILSRCACFFQRILAISCFFLFSRLFEFLMKYLIHSGHVAVHENIANRIAVAYTATNELLI